MPFSTTCDGGNSRGLFDRFNPDKLLSRPWKDENETKENLVIMYKSSLSLIVVISKTTLGFQYFI